MIYKDQVTICIVDVYKNVKFLTQTPLTVTLSTKLPFSNVTKMLMESSYARND